MDACSFTPVKGIFKLPPGKAIIVKDGKIIKEWTYHTLPYSGEVTDLSTEEIITELHTICLTR